MASSIRRARSIASRSRPRNPPRKGRSTKPPHPADRRGTLPRAAALPYPVRARPVGGDPPASKRTRRRATGAGARLVEREVGRRGGRDRTRRPRCRQAAHHADPKDAGSLYRSLPPAVRLLVTRGQPDSGASARTGRDSALRHEADATRPAGVGHPTSGRAVVSSLTSRYMNSNPSKNDAAPMRSSLPCARTSSMSSKTPDTP